MSGISPAAPTRMDRLQNHVTGSLLLNMIDNTTKLNKKFTSSSSSLSEDLKTLQTKVNQMYDSVTQAADKAQEAAKDASDANTTAQEAAKDASDAKDAAEAAADKVAAIADPVLKRPAEGADQTISGKLIATDFKSGDVSLVDLAGDVILKDPSAEQTISKNLKLSDGVLTIGSRVTGNTLLDVKGNIKSSGAITAGTIKTNTITTTGLLTIKSSVSGITPTLQVPKIFTTDITSSSLPTAKLISLETGGVKIGAEDGMKTVTMRGNTTIGTTDSGGSKNLTVHGQITSGNVTIGKPSTATEADPDLNVEGLIQTDGLTVNELNATGNLTVNGTITTDGNVTIGSTTSADLTVYGDIKTIAESTVDSKTTERTLTINGQGIKLTEKENGNEEEDEGKNILQLDVSPEDYARVWSKDTSLELKSNSNNLLLEGSNINLNSVMINVNSDMTIGTSDSASTQEVNVYGNIISTGTVTAGTIKTDAISVKSTTADSTIALNSPTQVNADMTIGTEDSPKKLTVNGDIEATDFKSGSVTLTGLAGDAVLKSSSSAQTITGELVASDFTTSGGVSLADLAGDAVLKSSTSDQTISGKLIASDFKSGDVTLTGLAGDAVLKSSTADQTISGKLIASDFKSGDVSLVDLANSVVLKNSSTAQTIYGNVNFGSSSSEANLSVNGVTKLNGQVTVGSSFADDDADLNVNGVTKLNGNVTIGKTSPGAGAGLTVYGDIISGDITSSDTLSANDIKTDAISVKSTTANSTIDLNSPTQVNADMTIGTSAVNANLTVNGNIESTSSVTVGSSTKIANLTVSNGTINIGRLNISYDPVSGVITFVDSTLGKSAKITLDAN